MSLADELLADLEEAFTPDDDGYEGTGGAALSAKRPHDAGDDDDMVDGDNDDETPGTDAMLLANSAETAAAAAVDRANALLLATRDLKQIARLWSSGELDRVLESVKLYAGKDPHVEFAAGSVVEEHPEYDVIFRANNLVVEIENEMMLVHKFIRDVYSKRFPELESLVLNPIDYARTVLIIGNELKAMSRLDEQLRTVLQGATVMVVTVTATTTRGVPLTPAELATVTEGCHVAIQMDQARRTIIDYVQSRMSIIAPNVTAIVGSTAAAQLMGAAGGIAALSKVPACNIPVLGANKKALAGFSANNLANMHAGYLYQSQLIQSTPADFRKKAVRITAAKAVLAARVDAAREAVDGAIGRKFRQDIDHKIEKCQEPPPTRDVKALPVPDEKRQKKRGGRRFRKMKEMYGATELQKLQNRIAFGQAEEEVINFDETEGLGMVGAHVANGKVRGMTANVHSKPKGNKLLAQHQKKNAAGQAASQQSGLSSSLVFTPVQGLEFVDPQAQQQKLKAINDRWFSANAKFVNVKKSSEQ